MLGIEDDRDNLHPTESQENQELVAVVFFDPCLFHIRGKIVGVAIVVLEDRQDVRQFLPGIKIIPCQSWIIPPGISRSGSESLVLFISTSPRFEPFVG